MTSNPGELVLIPARSGAQASGQVQLVLLQYVDREAAGGVQQLVGRIARIDADGQYQRIE